MLKNKKYGKLAVLSLLGILGITSCSSSGENSVYAMPSNYNDPVVIVTEDDGTTASIHNNIMNIITDAIHNGSMSSKVLDEVLYKYAESIYGAYSQVTLKDPSKLSLKEAADIASRINAHNENAANPDATADEKVRLNEFVKAHKVYWIYNEKGKHIDATTKQEVTNEASWTPSFSEYENVESKFEDGIEKSISASMYSKISSGSYSKKKFFREFDFVKALYLEGKKVDYAAALADKPNLKPTIISYQLEKEDVFDKNNFGVLTRNYYQSANATYIEDEIVPEVYKDLLVEQYLLDQELAAVRNSRARKINVLKIEKYSSWPINADILLDAFINELYGEISTADHIRYNAEASYNYINNLFQKYEMVSKGLYDKINAAGNQDAQDLVKLLQAYGSDIYEEAKFQVENPEHTLDPSQPEYLYDYTYYKNTAYGDLVKEFEKFYNGAAKGDYDALDMTLYNKFTENGTCEIEEGFDQARIDIAETKAITKGWFINSSQPSLDSNGKINERLFTISVANSKLEVKDDTDETLADMEAKDRFVKSEIDDPDNPGSKINAWHYRGEPVENEDTFLTSINGSYFLKFDGKSSGEDEKYDIVYDDGSAYYIVQVCEAVKDSKLKRTGEANDVSYAVTRGADFYNEVIDAVTKKVAETGSYASLAKTHWLKKMNISYHDQKVYDYFKENYPELFE